MRYLLTQDDDCHWYVIPADKQDEFDDFIYGDDHNEWPDWAHRVGGAPSMVTFTDVEIFGEVIS